MNFQALPTIDTAQEYLDKAFSRARKRGTAVQKNKEQEKITMVVKTLTKDLGTIITKYPDFANLPEFYEELCQTHIDLDKTRQTLGRLQGTFDEIKRLGRAALKEEDVTKQFYGRISGLMKKISPALIYLEKLRRTLTTFPNIKELYTVALAGFPNVGKSTLLAALTPAKPKIANYAFTTKTLNIGYYKQGYKEVQVIDTPGTLARFEKMNAIEQQAYLALKYVADIIVFIIDPTETYPINIQEQLLEQIKEHDKDIIIYISKTDIAEKEAIQTIQKKYPDAINSAKELQELIKP